jgi:hypothetical protein
MNSLYSQLTKYLLGLPLLIMIGVSCKKFVQIPPAPDQLLTSQVFADSADATSAVLDLYIDIMAIGNPGPLNSEITIYSGLSADELYSTTGSSDDNAFYVNNIPTDSYTLDNVWSGFYQEIYAANACIAGLNNSKTLSITLKNQLLGEAQVVRALVYFNMINLYGAAPLVTSTNYQTNAILPRTSIDSIYAQIETDLKSSQSLLTTKYPSSGNVRPNLYTATALLAKVYLCESKWPGADSAATQVISSGLYSLPSNLNTVFLAGSPEAIWQIIPSLQGSETSEGSVFVPTDPTVIPSYVINTFLQSAFEQNDLRFSNWLDSNVVNGQAYYYPYKYKLPYDGNTTPLEDYMVLRLGEQYLIRAEAKVQEGKSGAATDLNTIRNRAGLPNTTASSKSDLLTAIYHERQVELFCEWGNRWYDLKRTGLTNSVMPNVEVIKGGSWSAEKALWPIPLNEIQSNVYLTQNPGY